MQNELNGFAQAVCRAIGGGASNQSAGLVAQVSL
jgi:hypothetical protein